MTAWMQSSSNLLALLLGLALSVPGTFAATQGPPSVALFYEAHPPVSELRAFDWVVLDPDHGFLPADKVRAPSLALAYVAVGELHPSRPWFGSVDPAWMLGENRTWGSRVMDMSNPAWRAFLIEKVMQPMWDKGYRGFFLDTLDSFRLIQGIDEQPQLGGLAAFIRELKARLPQARVIMNRGFEILPQVQGLIDMVAAESLFRAWDAAQQSWREVGENDRRWLLDRFDEARRQGVACLAIDYVPIHDRALARATARKIEASGCLPYVTDPALGTIGVGAVEVVPRRILLLYNGKEARHLRYTNAARYLQMPLEYPGYIVDYADINAPLPDDVHPDRYAGIVSWFTGGIPPEAAARVNAWWSERIDEGLPYAIVGGLPKPLSSDFQERLGITLIDRPDALQPDVSAPLLGLELPPPVQAAEDVFIPHPDAAILQGYRDASGQRLAAAAIMPRGGIVLDPFVLHELPGIEQSRWIMDPFAFMKQALRLPPLPAPDVTTENGRRLLMVHIDGDGFVSRAELPGAPLASRVLLEQVLMRYRIPTSMSIIEAETAAHGVHPETSQEAEEIARAMFRLPHVEPATHTFSHPYVWSRASREAGLINKATGSFYIDVPGYTFNLEREIGGSSRYISERLCPPDKPVKLIHWSGDCAPDAEAVRLADAAGLLNINGGDTTITRSSPSLSAVGSWGLRFDGVLQVHAPITNENIYTNLWTGPYDGFRRVIETLQMTDQPRRLKALSIYYHTYSASKPASLKALREVYDWALAQPVQPIYTSEYVRKVEDFYHGALARRGDAWIWRGDGHLRTLRLPPELGLPDIPASRNVAGWAPAHDGVYVHLAGHDALLATTPSPAPGPRLGDANGRIERLTAGPTSMRVSINGHVPLEWRVPEGCRSLLQGRALRPTSSHDGLLTYRIPDARTSFDIVCAP